MNKTHLKRWSKRGFSFIELMVVVLLIAGLSLFAVPKFKEAQKRQAGARSGGNLKTLNSAVTQYDIEHAGPPNGDGTAPEREKSEKTITIPLEGPDGGSGWCTAMSVYVENTAGIWSSPNQPDVPCYRYSTWAVPSGQPGAGTIKGLVQSTLNGDLNYEPGGYEETDLIPGTSKPKSWANGYEDVGRYENGQPEVAGK